MRVEGTKPARRGASYYSVAPPPLPPLLPSPTQELTHPAATVTAHPPHIPARLPQVDRMGLSDPAGLLALFDGDPEAVLKLQIGHMEYMAWRVNTMSREQGRLVKVYSLVDAAGLSMSHMLGHGNYWHFWGTISHTFVKRHDRPTAPCVNNRRTTVCECSASGPMLVGC